MDPKAIMSYYTWMKLTNGGTYVSSASLSFFFFHKGSFPLYLCPIYVLAYWGPSYKV